MGKRKTRAYALKAGDGWVYDVGAELTVKVGERRQGRRLAVLEYTTDQDEWPGHTHATEDEVFYVRRGTLTFRCGEQEFEVDDGGVVFLPSSVEHGYKIRGGGEAHLLVVTAPAPAPGSAVGWDGFIGGLEAGGDPRPQPPSLGD